MKTTEQKMNYLRDFKDLDFSTPEMFITFYLGKETTKVITDYTVKRHTQEASMFLDGVNLDFKSVKIDGTELKSNEYKISNEGLEILSAPEKPEFKLIVENEVHPNTNTELEGLYLSGDLLCTQNEPMGFRKITYSLDRPDNMVKCKVKIVGDEKTYPFMLSNGNLVEEGQENGVRFCTWEDPFPKSLHLFALVAGDLAELKDEYTTGSGRKIDIRFYCDHGAEHKCDFAIESLKNAMKWDEDRFNLEYDLDLYMVVAVDSFNMGAMENKGLNIFNSALVLADPTTATDINYHRIESVIGHEYFHNWTGNRVTLKNWFQLTLKEGLTVFRDQEFSADLNDAAVERIDMVKSLKSRQFPEDSGPLAHPIRPEKYKEMNNFYTATVYEKGAEVIRMLYILLGEDKFQKGMTEYFKKYDGGAITTEDFVNVMTAQDSKIDKEWFSRWYKTPGTPEVNIKEERSGDKLTVSFHQSNQISKQQRLGFSETYIPVKMSVYSKEGLKLPLKSDAKNQPFLDKGIVILKEENTKVVFDGVPEGYVCSYFEGFSSPVEYSVESSSRNLSSLIRYDQDNFNKYNAVKTSAFAYSKEKNSDHIESLKYVFKDGALSELMKSQIMEPPTVTDFIGNQKSFDPISMIRSQSEYVRQVGNEMGEVLINYLKETKLPPFKYSLEDKGRRALHLCAFEYLLASDKYKKEAVALAESLYNDADNMTMSFGLLQLLQQYAYTSAGETSKDFYSKNHNDQLTLQKWIGAYMSTPSFTEIEKRVAHVEGLEGYSDKIPNFVRALWGGFFRNDVVFHDPKGRGYKMLLNAILKIDVINPQMSSGLMKTFNIASRISGDNKEVLKKAVLEFESKGVKLSSNLAETFGSIKGAL